MILFHSKFINFTVQTAVQHADIQRVPKKHVTTFSAMTLTISARLQ